MANKNNTKQGENKGKTTANNKGRVKATTNSKGNGKTANNKGTGAAGSHVGNSGGSGDRKSNTHQKFRINRKIDNISPKLKERLDTKLSDVSNTYSEVALWLNRELKKSGAMLDGEPLTISLSSVGRYAARTHKMAARYAETREMVKEVIRIAKENPEVSLDEGGLQVIMMNLVEKAATINFDETTDEKIVDMMVAVSRTKAYKDRVYSNIKKDIEKGYDQFLKCITEVIQAPNEKAKAKAGRVLMKRYGIDPEQLDMGDDIGSKRLLGLFTEFRKVITNPVPRHKIDE